MISLSKPLIALPIGDPNGLGPELAVRLASRSLSLEVARIVLIGDAHVIDAAARRAGAAPAADLDAKAAAQGRGRVSRVAIETIRPKDLTPGRASPAGGRSACAALTTALDLARDGVVAGVLAMPLDHPRQQGAAGVPGDPASADEQPQGLLDVACRHLGFALDDGKVMQIAAMPTLWVASALPRGPLAAALGRLTQQRILQALRLLHATLEAAGLKRPRLCATTLNAGAAASAADLEEAGAILPAVIAARDAGMDCEGPIPADRAFRQALDQGVDGLLTMLADQASLATNLLGFDKGLTILAGLPFPVLGPATIDAPPIDSAPQQQTQPDKTKAAADAAAASPAAPDMEAAISALGLLGALTQKPVPAFRYRGDRGKVRRN